MTSLDKEEVAQAKRQKEQAHTRITAWDQGIKLLSASTGWMIGTVKVQVILTDFKQLLAFANKAEGKAACKGDESVTPYMRKQLLCQKQGMKVGVSAMHQRIDILQQMEDQQ